MGGWRDVCLDIDGWVGGEMMYNLDIDGWVKRSKFGYRWVGGDMYVWI